MSKVKKKKKKLNKPDRMNNDICMAVGNDWDLTAEIRLDFVAQSFSFGQHVCFGCFIYVIVLILCCRKSLFCLK